MATRSKKPVVLEHYGKEVKRFDDLDEAIAESFERNKGLTRDHYLFTNSKGERVMAMPFSVRDERLSGSI